MAAPEPPATPLEFGSYVLLKEVPGAAVGSTWIARTIDAPDGFELVSLLRIHRHLTRKAGTTESFLAETDGAHTFRHPSAVALLEVGVVDGEVFVASEHVDGEPLSGLIEATGSERLPTPIVLRMLVDVLEALAAAHAHGPALFHGELSPQHVVVGTDGRTRLAGLGTARSLAKVAPLSATNLTRLAYVAPERVKAMASPTAPQVAPDALADIFSMGVLMWECLGGQRLFASRMEAAVIQKVLTAPTPALASIPGTSIPVGVDESVQRALDRNPARRFQSADEFIAILGGATGVVLAARTEVAAFVEKLAGEALAARRSGLPAVTRAAPIPIPRARHRRLATLVGMMPEPPLSSPPPAPASAPVPTSAPAPVESASEPFALVVAEQEDPSTPDAAPAAADQVASPLASTQADADDPPVTTADPGVPISAPRRSFILRPILPPQTAASAASPVDDLVVVGAPERVSSLERVIVWPGASAPPDVPPAPPVLRPIEWAPTLVAEEPPAGSAAPHALDDDEFVLPKRSNRKLAIGAAAVGAVALVTLVAMLGSRPDPVAGPAAEASAVMAPADTGAKPEAPIPPASPPDAVTPGARRAVASAAPSVVATADPGATAAPAVARKDRSKAAPSTVTAPPAKPPASPKPSPKPSPSKKYDPTGI